MRRDLSHDEAYEALGAAALDALDAEESAAVLAHAADCPRCGPELASLRDTASMLAFAAPEVALPAEQCEPMRARLVARAREDASRRGHAGRAPTPLAVVPIARARRSYAWVALAAGAAFAASLGALALARGERDELRRELAAAQAAGAARARSLGDSLSRREQLLGALTGPAVSVVELASTGSRAPTARMFWDRATNRWTMFAHDLRPPARGRTYQLWLVTTRSEKISAGTFAPSAAGDAVVSATYALPAGSLQAIAVTEEPAGGVKQPTGAVVLAGSGR